MNKPYLLLICAELLLTAIACGVHLSHIFTFIIFFKKAFRNDFVEFGHLQVLFFLPACPDHL